MKLAKATLSILFFLTGAVTPSAETGDPGECGSVMGDFSSLLFLEFEVAHVPTGCRGYVRYCDDVPSSLDGWRFRPSDDRDTRAASTAGPSTSLSSPGRLLDQRSDIRTSFPN